MCKKFKQFKKRNTFYGQLPPNIIEVLKLWNLVHIDPIGPYSKSIIQQQPGGRIIQKYFSLACMKMIEPTTGWFEIFEAPCFELDAAARGNNE